MSFSRRHFLKQASAATLGFAGLQSFLVDGAAGRPIPRDVGFGPLQDDPQEVLDLPQGFTYRIVSRAGDEMTDGFRVPAEPDGMAAFPGPNGQTLLLRNHEISAGVEPEQGAFGPDNRLRSRLSDAAFYDQGKEEGPILGGVTTLVYDTDRQEVVGQHLSLAGTARNCAGGPTPWNSWITCEETDQRKGDLCVRDHGYNFEVPASAEPGLVDPVALRAMGRFRHEAVAVDPQSGAVYQTEDRHEGLIYRYLPHEPGRLEQGGRLQALAVIGQPSLDTRNWGDGPTIPPGTGAGVRWIDLENIQSPQDDLRFRGFEQGAARFARAEGMWYGRGTVYFACTNGGPKRKGQIWRYTPSPQEGAATEGDEPGRIELFVQPSDGSLIENADNITIAPWGDLIACEDGSDEQYLVGVTPEGDIYEFAHNAVSDSEFAGATFSPDGTTLFVNIQHSGLTLAIQGPWQRARQG